MYDKNVTNFCLLCNAIPTWIVNGITVWNTKNVSNVLKTLKVRLFEVFSNTMKKLRITWDKEFYYAYFSKSCIWMQLLIVAKISFFANSAALRSTYLWKSNCRPKISGMIFLREKYLCGLKFRGCKELFADGIDILLQNGAWVVRWTAAVANWAWPVVLGIIPEQFCIKPQSVKEGWMALVQWTSRELLCTIRSQHTDTNRISVFIFFHQSKWSLIELKKKVNLLHFTFSIFKSKLDFASVC